MIETFDVELPHGIRLACRGTSAAGLPADAPSVLFLHGFPEAAFVWDPVMQRLAGRVRCLAPNLRGYAGSSAPAEVEAYRAKHLVADLCALVEQFGDPLDLLVAHDWGGALAWGLAALHPAKLKRLLILNAPHPAALLRELRHNPAQQSASRYMNFLCRPDAEALLAENDFARLWPFFEGDGASWLDAPMRERFRAAWRHGLTGPLNYYRASPLRPATGPQAALHTLVLPAQTVRVMVPTFVLWGQADRALLPGLLDGLEAWVPTLHVQRVATASHWIVHEAPDRIAGVVERWLGSAPSALQAL